MSGVAATILASPDGAADPPLSRSATEGRACPICCVVASISDRRTIFAECDCKCDGQRPPLQDPLNETSFPAYGGLRNNSR